MSLSRAQARQEGKNGQLSGWGSAGGFGYQPPRGLALALIGGGGEEWGEEEGAQFSPLETLETGRWGGGGRRGRQRTPASGGPHEAVGRVDEIMSRRPLEFLREGCSLTPGHDYVSLIGSQSEVVQEPRAHLPGTLPCHCNCRDAFIMEAELSPVRRCGSQVRALFEDRSELS